MRAPPVGQTDEGNTANALEHAWQSVTKLATTRFIVEGALDGQLFDDGGDATLPMHEDTMAGQHQIDAMTTTFSVPQPAWLQSISHCWAFSGGIA